MQWGNPTRGVPSNGSIFFVDTGKSLVAVTARHVYEASCETALQDPRVVCQIDNLRFDPRQRVIALGRDCDMATFAFRKDDLAEIGKTTVPWPPVVPVEGAIVLFAGLPGETKKSPEPGHVEGGYLTGLARVDSINDRDISCVIPPNELLLDVIGKGLPPPDYDLGGMSGGPVAVVSDTDSSILSWSIAGVIYECGGSFRIIKAVRADRIGDDGVIN